MTSFCRPFVNHKTKMILAPRLVNSGSEMLCVNAPARTCEDFRHNDMARLSWAASLERSRSRSWRWSTLSEFVSTCTTSDRRWFSSICSVGDSALRGAAALAGSAALATLACVARRPASNRSSDRDPRWSGRGRPGRRRRRRSTPAAYPFALPPRWSHTRQAADGLSHRHKKPL